MRLIDVYSRMDRRDTVFLDSSMECDLGRRSVIGMVPYRVHTPDSCTYRECLNAIGDGALMGYISYDEGALANGIALKGRMPEVPGFVLADFDVLIVQDLVSGEVSVTCKGRVMPVGEEESLARMMLGPAGEPPAPCGRGYRITDDTSKEGFIDAVERARDMMGEGEFYIVNIARMLEVSSDTDPFDAFLRLRRFSPSPFGAYLDICGIQVISSSMELLLDIDGGRAVTRPIKGTCPRTGDPEIDKEGLEGLLGSGKEFSELLMVTDMERNDMNRFCRPGSVEVRGFRVPEEHPTVFHTVSDIAGDVREDVRLGDIVSCMFPGGSVTGAPKVACMTAIDALERSGRGVYTGSIGWFSRDRTVMSIAIRTMVHLDGRYMVGVGGGITYESDPLSEYEETALKSKAMMRALGEDLSDVGVFETMRVHGGDCLMLEEHLGRMTSAAGMLGICRTVSAEDVRERVADGSLDGRALRVEVSSRGVSFSDRPIPYTDGDRVRGFRVAVSDVRRDEGSLVVGMKTTLRGTLDSERSAARSDGFDEVLFLNGRGEICECSVSNVFFVRDGRIVTPRASCGLLPGIVRGYVMERFDVSEETVRMEDLRGFEGCFLTNSLFGVMPVASIGDVGFADRDVAGRVLSRYVSDMGMDWGRRS